MINVSDEVKAKLKSDSCKKYMYVDVDGVGAFTNEQIWYESFKLEESVINSTWEFVGCISNKMSVTVQMPNNGMLESAYKNREIMVRIKVVLDVEDGIESLSEYIPLFVGYIDSAEKSADRSYIKFTCYDALYYKGQTNVYNWYKTLGGYKWTSKGRPISDIIGELLTYLDIPYSEADFVNCPNYMVKVKNRFKKYKDLTAIQLIEAFCQINGCFGWIDHYGMMRWKYVKSDEIGGVSAYPSRFYPNTIVPSQPEKEIVIVNESVEYYRTLEFDETLIYPLANGVTIRATKDSSGVSAVLSDIPDTIDWDDDTDDGYLDSDEDDVKEGSFIIESNMFAFKLSKKKQKAIACNLLKKLSQSKVAFRQFKLEINGLPYMEMGDKITVPYKRSFSGFIEFIITNRTLSGIQSMVDTYTAKISDSDVNFITEGSTPSEITTKSEYVSTGQYQAIESATVSESYGEVVANQLASKEVMVVVSWDATTGILETTSELITVQDKGDI